MSRLGAVLAFPLGEEYRQPFIVNLAPAPDQTDFYLTDPVRFSVRDAETYVIPDQLRFEVGYAQVTANGLAKYDSILPGTTLGSTISGALDVNDAPAIAVTTGVQIAKTVNGPQKSVYLTKIDSGDGYRSVMATAVVTPNTISTGEPGAVFGIENGPRNTGVYIIFERSSGTPQIRMCGPLNSSNTRSPNTVIAQDWTGTNRYILTWNEVRGVVSLYLVQGDVASILNEEDISSFQAYDLLPGATPSHASNSQMVLVYGIEGKIGETVTLGNVAITMDVGFPIVGLVRPGEFYTTRRTDETVRYDGGELLRAPISSWFLPNNTFFNTPDPTGELTILKTNIARVTKNTLGDSFAIFREDPSLLGSDANGFMIEGTFFGIPEVMMGGQVTGMGFLVYDGQTAFYIAMMGGPNRTMGLLVGSGDPGLSSSYNLPATDIDWSSPTSFRLIADPRRGKIDLYGVDISTPLLTVTFDRSSLPTSSTIGVEDGAAIVAFGHIPQINTSGSMDLTRVKYACTFQAYEAPDGYLPDVVPTDPIWNSTAGGFSAGPPDPLFGLALIGGGFGMLAVGLYLGTSSSPTDTATIVNGELRIQTSPGVTHTYSRALDFDADRGVLIEIKLHISASKPRARTGYIVMIDNGLNSYMLSFVDTEIGKFVCIPIRSGDGFVEVVGTEGLASQLSAQVHWDEPHIYRIEVRPLDGVYLFVDNAIEPTLKIPVSARVNYPTAQFGGTSTVAFGHLSGEGCTSFTDYVRVAVSAGYEVSAKRVETTTQLEQNVRNSQAIIVAFAEDNDP